MDTKLKKLKMELNKKLCIIMLILFGVLFVFSSGLGLSAAFILSATFIGISSLALYEYLESIFKKYLEILKITEQLAEGNFQKITTNHLGLFEPMKENLCKLQDGFQIAVEKEINSNRMKTELITNVSHDLKTPLTAITTYVELLKKEDITEEEQKSYIEILEKKSARMKVLIEDLLDLSKASSNDMVLDISNVNIVNLLKQVTVEHEEKYQEMGLELIWKVPEERVELSLDNQKTYRIFENLFINIEKYAMKNSRVYIDVCKRDEDIVEITIRNMSAEPLYISGEQLTERFVRGDVSRNTEGSGLGLAIAKSFTEVQKGSFEVVVDGDLFKSTMLFKK